MPIIKGPHEHAIASDRIKKSIQPFTRVLAGDPVAETSYMNARGDSEGEYTLPQKLSPKKLSPKKLLPCFFPSGLPGPSALP